MRYLFFLFIIISCSSQKEPNVPVEKKDINVNFIDKKNNDFSNRKTDEKKIKHDLLLKENSIFTEYNVKYSLKESTRHISQYYVDFENEEEAEIFSKDKCRKYTKSKNILLTIGGEQQGDRVIYILNYYIFKSGSYDICESGFEVIVYDEKLKKETNRIDGNGTVVSADLTKNNKYLYLLKGGQTTEKSYSKTSLSIIDLSKLDVVFERIEEKDFCISGGLLEDRERGVCFINNDCSKSYSTQEFLLIDHKQEVILHHKSSEKCERNYEIRVYDSSKFCLCYMENGSESKLFYEKDFDVKQIIDIILRVCLKPI